MKKRKYYSLIFFGGQMTEDHFNELEMNMEKLKNEDNLEEIRILAITTPGIGKFNVILEGILKSEEPSEAYENTPKTTKPKVSK